MTEARSIEIRDLYKIFGSAPERHVDAVKGGMNKTEPGNAHGHILGLNNINISMPAGKIQVVMGFSGSGKSTLVRHINRLIEPTAGQVLIDGQDVLRMRQRVGLARAPSNDASILRDGQIVQQGNSQMILMKPADDCIRRFIKDVNRGRFLMVDAVMERGQGTGPEIPSGTTLD